MVLMASITRGLELEEEAVIGSVPGRNGTYRLLHFAPTPEGFELADYLGCEPETIEDGRKLLARTHVDTGILALLWQDATSGLQMQGPMTYGARLNRFRMAYRSTAETLSRRS